MKSILVTTKHRGVFGGLVDKALDEFLEFNLDEKGLNQ